VSFIDNDPEMPLFRLICGLKARLFGLTKYCALLPSGKAVFLEGKDDV